MSQISTYINTPRGVGYFLHMNVSSLAPNLIPRRSVARLWIYGKHPRHGAMMVVRDEGAQGAHDTQLRSISVLGYIFSSNVVTMCHVSCIGEDEGHETTQSQLREEGVFLYVSAR